LVATDLAESVGKHRERIVLGITLLLHVAATCVLLPPWEGLRPEPLRVVDYPIHTHRVFLYRQGLTESAAPWGYDPAVAAGQIAGPANDLGAKPLQVLGMLLPFLAPGAVVRLFLFLAVLTLPAGTLLACRRLNVARGDWPWILLALLGPLWLYHNLLRFLYWGLVTFVAASYFAPYVLALLLSLLDRPRLRTYLLLCLASSLLFLIHILGPLPILPSLVLYGLAARGLPARWRLAIAAVPLVVLLLNAFWFAPFWLGRGAQVIPFVTQEQPPRRHLTYADWSELLGAFSPFNVAIAVFGGVLAAHGSILLYRRTGRRVALAFALAGSLTLAFRFLGSFIPYAASMQPSRFLLPAVVLLALPVGVSLHRLSRGLRLPRGAAEAAAILFAITAAVWSGRPDPLLLPPRPDPLADFVEQRTTPEERLLVQTNPKIRSGPARTAWEWHPLRYQSKILPLAFGRETIGSSYPYSGDVVEFGRERLWGRRIEDWDPPELRATLERWGVAWVFTHSEPGATLMQDTLGVHGEPVGHFLAFRVPGSPSRFEAGTGDVVARVNRFELSNLEAEGGVVVLRYRYHPAWEAEPPVEIRRHPVPEEPSGFIALLDPPSSVTLRFRPWEFLRTPPWP
jgi:hypothetical protein